MLEQWKYQIISMEITLRKNLLFLFLAFSIVSSRGENLEKSSKTNNDVDASTKRGSNGGGGGGGVGWGWGAGGGGANERGQWGWGNGGGGGVYWRWGCNGRRVKRGQHSPKTRVFQDDEYIMGEFAQCMVKGRCRGMRLDCPLHCGGPCVYDCRHMCKAHCKR